MEREKKLRKSRALHIIEELLMLIHDLEPRLRARIGSKLSELYEIVQRL